MSFGRGLSLLLKRCSGTRLSEQKSPTPDVVGCCPLVLHNTRMVKYSVRSRSHSCFLPFLVCCSDNCTEWEVSGVKSILRSKVEAVFLAFHV